MRAKEFIIEQQIEEGWKSAVAGGLIGGALATGAANYTANKTPQNPTTEPTQQTQTSKSWNLFSTPQIETFDNGIYHNNSVVAHLLGGYSDDPSGEGYSQAENKPYDADIKIENSKISLIVGEGSKGLGEQVITFDKFEKNKDYIKAVKKSSNQITGNTGYAKNPATGKLDPVNTHLVNHTRYESLVVKKNGEFEYRVISTSDDPYTEKGYKYHTWGWSGQVSKVGKDI